MLVLSKVFLIFCYLIDSQLCENEYWESRGEAVRRIGNPKYNDNALKNMKTATASSLFVCHAGGVEDAGGDLEATVIVLKRRQALFLYWKTIQVNWSSIIMRLCRHVVMM